MPLSLIPPGPRIPLPSPNYEERLAHAAESASLGRKLEELHFKVKREGKLAWRAFRRLPGWKRRIANLMRHRPAAHCAQTKISASHTSSEHLNAAPTIPWSELL
jgi:hypothetical protein